VEVREPPSPSPSTSSDPDKPFCVLRFTFYVGNLFFPHGSGAKSLNLGLGEERAET
jgi:hypothetical protein